jgi:hypothetical protein
MRTDKEFVSDKELETIFDIKENTWQKWRSLGVGPPTYRFGRKVKSKLSEVLEWAKQKGVKIKGGK